ncbi:MAG: thiol reductant ABC exporter subunit CydC [Longispora sp.]|nr:thiol reductant ABC exporter subunit CydC [Longispora sp. (in: high G+C Gram-positive bacteria)]
MNRRLVLAWLTGTLAAASATALAATAAWLISRAAQHPPVLHLMVAVVAVRAFGIGRGILRYAERLTGHDAALHLLARIRVNLYERLRHVTTITYRHGDLATRIVDDVDAHADGWLRVRLPYAAALTVGVATVTAMAWVLPTAAAVLAVTLLVVAIGAPWLAIRHSRHHQARIAPLAADLNTTILTTLRNAPEIIAYGCVDSALQAIAAHDRQLTTAQRRAAFGRGAGGALATAAAGIALLAALALSANAASRGELNVELIAVVVVTCLALHELFATLVPAAADLPRIRAARERIEAIQPAPERPVTATLTTRRDLRVSGLNARGCHLPDIAIPEGGVHVLTGPSGSGKSSLAAAMVRLLDPDAGTISLGGVNIADVDANELRRVIGLCAQDAHIFDNTIAANLRVARPEASDGQLWDALGAARLDDWVRELPEGLDTHVGEYGMRLSGGQRQRLALARVLLADFPVVIFDEPTEHLDPVTASELMVDVLAASAGRTVLLITHQVMSSGTAVSRCKR